MIRFKRAISMTMAVCTMASMVTACGGNSSKSAESTSAAATPKQIVPITVLVHDRGTIPSSEGTLDDNWFTKWVNEQAGKDIGVSVKFVSVPNAQREQVLATRLASGDAPDVSYTYDLPTLSNYSMNGGLTELKDLLDKYGTNIKKKVPSNFIDQVKIDGKLTSIPTMGVATDNATWIRKDWLDKLGLKAPTNIDEFYNVLKQFKEKDPGKVGSKLMPFALPASGDVAMGGIETSILPAFVKDAPSGDKLVQPYYFWPEAKEAVRFLNKLYNEKLMGEFVIDKDQSQFKQKVIKGELGSTVFFSFWPYLTSYGSILDNLQKNIPDANLTATYPWKDTNAKENFYGFFQGGASQSRRYFVPKSSKNPEAAFKYIDWMASDMYIDTVYFGIKEGTDYKVVDGLKQLVDEKSTAHIGWVQPQYYSSEDIFLNDPVKFLKTYSTSGSFNSKYSAQFVNETIAGDKASRFATPVLSGARPANDKYRATLNKKWDSYLVSLVTKTSSNFDAAYDEAISTLKAEGGDEILKETADLYKKQYGK